MKKDGNRSEFVTKKNEPKNRGVRYEELLKGLTERRPRCVEVGPESLKLTKLSESDNIKAILTTFERAAEDHGIER